MSEDLIVPYGLHHQIVSALYSEFPREQPPLLMENFGWFTMQTSPLTRLVTGYLHKYYPDRLVETDLCPEHKYLRSLIQWTIICWITRNVMWFVSRVFITEHADGIQVIPDLATLFSVQWLLQIIMTYFEKSGRILLFVTILHKKNYLKAGIFFTFTPIRKCFSLWSQKFIYFLMQIKNNFQQ